jgi:hypothetical protein
MCGLRKLQCARVLRIFRNLACGRDDVSSEALAEEKTLRVVWLLKIRAENTCQGESRAVVGEEHVPKPSDCRTVAASPNGRTETIQRFF